MEGKITNEVRRSWISISASIIDIPKYPRPYFEITAELKTNFYNRQSQNRQDPILAFKSKVIKGKKMTENGKNEDFRTYMKEFAEKAT